MVNGMDSLHATIEKFAAEGYPHIQSQGKKPRHGSGAFRLSPKLG
jgi:hypothetical protein